MPEPPPIPSPKTPVLAWVIAVYYFVTSVFALLSYALLPYLHMLPLPEAQKQYLTSMTWVDHSATMALYASNVLAGVLLLLRRRHALHLFCLAFAFGVFEMGYQIVARHLLSVMGPLPLIGLPAAWGIRIAIIFYTRSLIKNGILR